MRMRPSPPISLRLSHASLSPSRVGWTPGPAEGRESFPRGSGEASSTQQVDGNRVTWRQVADWRLRLLPAFDQYVVGDQACGPAVAG